MKYTKAEMFADWIETANTIAADLRRLSAEVDEQARLNGMGAECELKLMAERDELRQKLALSEESDAENLRLYRAVRDQRDALRAEIERMRAAPAPVAQGEPVALPADFLEWARNLLVRERARLDGFVAIGNELHRAATYDRWIAALNATPTRACHSDAPKHRAVALADDLDEWALMETEQGKVLRTIPALEAEIERLRAAPDPVAQPVAWWIPKAEQFCLAKQDGSRPFAKAWEPLYAAPAPVELTRDHVMSALALCPTDLSHPKRCEWIANELNKATGQKGGAA